MPTFAGGKAGDRDAREAEVDALQVMEGAAVLDGHGHGHVGARALREPNAGVLGDDDATSESTRSTWTSESPLAVLGAGGGLEDDAGDVREEVGELGDVRSEIRRHDTRVYRGGLDDHLGRVEVARPR